MIASIAYAAAMVIVMLSIIMFSVVAYIIISETASEWMDKFIEDQEK